MNNKTPTSEEIHSWLRTKIADYLFIEPEGVDIDINFNTFGLSSKDAILLSGDLEEWLGKRISPTVIYEYPTINSLARYILEDLFKLTVVDQDLKSSNEIVVQDINLNQLVSELEQISDEEAEALLIEKLNPKTKK